MLFSIKSVCDNTSRMNSIIWNSMIFGYSKGYIQLCLCRKDTQTSYSPPHLAPTHFSLNLVLQFPYFCNSLQHHLFPPRLLMINVIFLSVPQIVFISAFIAFRVASMELGLGICGAGEFYVNHGSLVQRIHVLFNPWEINL